MKILVESLKRMYKALSQRNRFPSVSQRAVFQRMNMNISQEKNSPEVIQNESA